MSEMNGELGLRGRPGRGLLRRGGIRASLAAAAAATAAVALVAGPARADQVGPPSPNSTCPGPSPCKLIHRDVWVPTSEGHNVGCVSDTDPTGYYRTYTVYQGLNWVDKNGHEYWGAAWISMDKGGNMPYYTQSSYGTFECEDTNVSPGP